MRTVYVKSSLERDPLYRQQTLILQEGDRRLVRKIPVGEAAREHLRDYGRNRKLLEESLRPDGRIGSAVAIRQHQGLWPVGHPCGPAGGP